MKYLVLFLLIYVNSLCAQRVLPFVDFNNQFKTFYLGNFRVIDMQQIRNFKAGDDILVYTDIRGNLRLDDGQDRREVTNLIAKYEVSDHLFSYQIGSTLNMWDQKLRTLTYNVGLSAVTDSLVVFQDLRYNTLNTYYEDSIYELYQAPVELAMPLAIGEDIIAYKDNGDLIKLFYKGVVTELGVWNGSINISCGTSILCLNDPTTRTFAVFENGQFSDVESVYVQAYQAGRSFVAYVDQNGNLYRYGQGNKEALSNFSPSKFEVKDDLVYWEENNQTFLHQNGAVIRLTTYKPKDYKLKNNTFVFRNNLGGVSVVDKGKLIDITNVMQAEYEIYGNSVMVTLPNKSVIVYSDGKLFNH